MQKPLRGLFSQVFTAYPENIALDDKSLTYKQAVSARSDILSWLVKQELRELDQLNLKALNKYLKNRIKYELPQPVQKSLAPIYFLRCLIAHNSGFVASRQTRNLPPEISVQNGEIRISNEFLKGSAAKIREAVNMIDQHVVKKWPRVEEDLPIAIADDIS